MNTARTRYIPEAGDIVWLRFTRKGKVKPIELAEVRRKAIALIGAP